MDWIEALNAKYPGRPAGKHGHDIGRAYRDPGYLITHAGWLSDAVLVDAARSYASVKLCAAVLVYTAYLRYGEWVTVRYPARYDPIVASMACQYARRYVLTHTIADGVIEVIALPALADALADADIRTFIRAMVR